jgi:hypothetical protein
MTGKRNIILLLVSLMFATLLFSAQVYAQVLSEEGYDQRYTEGAVTPFEEDDALLRINKVNEIISRIRRGDRTVLRLVVFDTMEAVHDEIVRRASGTDGYYREVGYTSAIPAFIGGFDNQDPKVRLKSIGFLGDWVDEIGKELPMIEQEVDKRLASTVETRREVRYAFRVLKMKIVRVRVLRAIKKGDDQVLVTISPEDFLPLVFYEPRIRTIYLGNPGVVHIRSITLDRGVAPETGELVGDRPGRAPGLDLERICLKVEKHAGRDLGEVAQYFRGSNNVALTVTDESLTVPINEESSLDWKCLRGLFAGINNKSLFVREQCARIFLNYVRGLSGNKNYLVPDPNKAGEYRRAYSTMFAKLASDPYIRRIAQVAWENVKWSEFYYWDRHDVNLKQFIKNAYYFERKLNEPDDANRITVSTPTKRYYTQFSSLLAGQTTEVTGNYRNDIKEINRLIGQEYILDAEYDEEKVQIADLGTVQTAVDTLFNDSRTTSGRPPLPDRHDILMGEAAYEMD